MRSPSYVMRQIRNGVRQHMKPQAHKDSEISVQEVSSSNELAKNVDLNTKRLHQRITPSIPVAFVEPHLVSRFRILGKIIVPIRKFGARLFTKWYADVFTSQQKHLNNEIWFGLNTLISVVDGQNKIIAEMGTEISKLQEELLQHKSNIEMAARTEISKLEEELLQHNREMQEVKHKIGLGFDFDYSVFAKRFSAPSNAVKEIYSQYIRYFNKEQVVVDLGCGGGAFLELLKDNNIQGVGVDSDERLVATCIQKGLNAVVGDVNEYITIAEDNSIDAIFMGHVIEHLPVHMKIEFLLNCYRKLKHGGVFILETPNTTSSFVMHNLYYLDPTHEKPLLPEGLKFMCEAIGFEVVNSYLSSPIEGVSENNSYYNFSLVLKK